jgi:hypothetical protein
MDDVSNRFEPLSEPEKHTSFSKVSTPNARAREEDGELVSPIPADAPDAPKPHPRFGLPTAAWTYRDAHGAPLFHVLRFDPPGERKQFLPLSLWREAAGLRWRWKGVLSPRPLYGLYRLAALPTAPIVVCEGEKAADAAARVFPRSVAVTSPGGAQAAGQCDWAPLAGRRVLMWPDADEPGAKYALEVARILDGLQCEVSIIDAAALASMAPDGGKREPIKGYDAADAIAEWRDVTALRKAAHGHATPFDPSTIEQCAPAIKGDEGPLPLFPPLPPSASYPVDALGVLAPAAKAIARKVQVPPAIAAQSVLAVAALAAQAHADVLLPFGQTRPLSLYFATVIGSGDRKSSADNEACWPVAIREKSLREAYQFDLKAWKITNAAWCAEKRKIEGDKTIDMSARRERLAQLGEEPPKPLAPFLITGDLTLERLAKHWTNAHPALGVFTAEGGTFTGGHGMSDENRLRTAAALSECWDGKPIKRIRALDGVTILPGRRLSMHVMIQPDASAGFLANPVLRDQGLLSRVLVAAPESIAGTRFYRDPEPSDEAAIAAYGARILSILETPPSVSDGAPNELAPRALPLSADATALWKQFFNHVESQSGMGAELSPIRDFASKAGEHAARVAGVLTIANDLRAEEIGFAAMESAVALMNWHLAEAERLHCASRTDAKLLRAALLLDWLNQRPGDVCAFRDILQFGPRALRTKAAAEEAVSILKDHRWLFETSQRPRAFALAKEARA